MFVTHTSATCIISAFINFDPWLSLGVKYLLKVAPPRGAPRGAGSASGLVTLGTESRHDLKGWCKSKAEVAGFTRTARREQWPTVQRGDLQRKCRRQAQSVLLVRATSARVLDAPCGACFRAMRSVKCRAMREDSYELNREPSWQMRYAGG